MRAAKVQASLRIRAVSPEPPLLAHTSNESRGTFRQKARSLAPLNGWACAVKICHDAMLEDTNSLDRAQLVFFIIKRSCADAGKMLTLLKKLKCMAAYTDSLERNVTGLVVEPIDYHTCKSGCRPS